jgi:hypothetical protein
MNAENCKLVHDLLMPVCTNDDGTCDMWTFFLASGLTFAFLEMREEVGQEILATMQAGLNAKTSPDVSFEDGEIIGTAIKTFHRLADLKLSTEDAAKAVAEDTAYMAMYCPDNTNTPIDVSWTRFKLGSRSPVSGYGRPSGAARFGNRRTCNGERGGESRSM